MQNIGFAPTEVKAKVGDTIRWINKDILSHTATARNGDWEVNIAASKTATLVLKKAGDIDYYCRFHPNMKAHISIAPE
jgi:plastocyanin